MFEDDDYDEDDGPMLRDLFDADGNMRVQRQRCGTCIYWDDNRMHLRPGQREQLEAAADAEDSWITCHQTLPNNHQYDAPPAVCHGYWIHGKLISCPLRIALMFDKVAEVEPPSLTWNEERR